MERLVEPELLDGLPVTDPGAGCSRRDLRLINRILGHRGIVEGALAATPCPCQPRRIVELGAGDGTFLLRLARRLARWPVTAADRPDGEREIRLVDRQDLVTAETRWEFERLGWRVESTPCDVFDWLNGPPDRRADLMLANLFLHHFDEARLPSLLALAAPRANRFIACEPRRSRFALSAARLVGLLGCHPVTRQDAVTSVRAGFAGDELSRAWPVQDGWQLREEERGLFSHLFVVERRKD